MPSRKQHGDNLGRSHANYIVPMNSRGPFIEVGDRVEFRQTICQHPPGTLGSVTKLRGLGCVNVLVDGSAEVRNVKTYMLTLLRYRQV